MLNKIESVEEFLARGGTITKCETKIKARRFKQVVEEAEIEEVDWSLIPEHIKIRLGTRSGQEAK